MKERPIIFNGEMVRAILEGRKTMTRRVIKPPFEIHPNGYITRRQGNERLCPYICPYGQPGDRLWVRETYRIPNGAPKGWVDYKADDTRKGFKWCPSIHMPRWASRITLEIVSVRAERLQDISEKDAIREGIIQLSGAGLWKDYQCVKAGCAYPSQSFHSFWDSIYAKRGLGWGVNPWVWVIEFKMVQEGGER